MSIATEITRLDTAKANLKTSINAKGGTITNETLDDYYLAVDNLAGGTPTDGTAVAGDILATKTAYSGNPASKITGTMTNRGEVDTAITIKTQVVTIAQGYHNGSGTTQISATEQAKIIDTNIKAGVTILGVAGAVRPYTLLASGIVFGAVFLDPSPVTYDWTTQFTAWNGKTILLEWTTTFGGTLTKTFKVFNQTVTAGSSGIKIGKIMSSTEILLTGATTNNTSTTNITFSGLDDGEYVEMTMNVYEVI